MLRTLFSFTPFMICLCWFVTFLLHYPKSDSAKKLLTWFLMTCVTLYLCHGLYFTIGLSRFMESIWTLCSLSVYPLFFAYICRLVSRPLTPSRLFLILFPGILVAISRYVFPGDCTDTARKLLNMVQIIAVCYCGFRRLVAFDRELADTYADTDGRDIVSVKHLLIAFIVISVCSAVANAFGKQYFLQNDWLILLVRMPFSVLLFALSYIGFTRSFTMEQFDEDTKEDEQTADVTVEYSEIGARLQHAVVERQLFLTQNLKIGDVVRETGICRTNISSYINQTKGMSFSDYINRLRVEYAKTLLKDSEHSKNIAIAYQSGFASEQSFYRNFTKFTGMKTSEWIMQSSES